MLRQCTVVFAWKCRLFCLCVHVQFRVCYIYHVEFHFRFTHRVDSEDDLKIEDDLKNGDDLKNEDDLKMKTTSTVTATPLLMFNRKWYQASKPEMEFHMINITYVALHMHAQTEKTTFSCKDDCTLTKRTRRWTYIPLCGIFDKSIKFLVKFLSNIVQKCLKQSLCYT